MDYQEIWTRQKKNNKLNHAYVLIGKYLDKMEAGRWFARLLEISSADLFIINEEKSISIESVQEAQQRLSLAPFNSSWQMVVINRADNLTIEAQNSLLKILEEPPKTSILLLLAESEKSLLSTIVSRCQRINLKVRPDQLVIGTEKLPKELIEGNWGVEESFKYAEKIAKEPNVGEILDGWELEIRRLAIQSEGEKYLRLLEEIKDSKDKMKSNTNNRLILENIMLKFL